jgi:cullin-associated NEDD8-dissociated protein 1
VCSDDEDSSWKVRRAAAGALAAVFRAYPTVIVALYARCAGRLVSRFREREESVKLEVFKSFSALIAQVRSPLSVLCIITSLCGAQTPTRLPSL